MINLMKSEPAIVLEMVYTFNEADFFNDLVAKEGLNEDILNDMQLTNEEFKFVYQKDNEGSWYKFNYKGDEKINHDNVPHWIRPHMWQYEKDNNIFQ